MIGFVSLTLEIAYTRVVSFKLFYYYTYLVIGLALLGLGAASAVVSLSTRLRSLDVLRLVRLVAPAAAMVGLIGYLVVARIPTDTHLIWTGDPARPPASSSTSSPPSSCSPGVATRGRQNRF